MIKNHDVRVRVTKDQYDRIVNHSRAKGFVTISAFIRDVTLRNPLTVEIRIVDIDQRVKHIEEMVTHLYNKFK